MRQIGAKVLGREPAPPAPAQPVIADPPTAQAAATAAKIEQAGGDAPAQKPGESDKSYEVRLSNALSDLQREQSEKLRHKKRGDDAEARASELDKKGKELQAIVDGARGNVERALELAGVTPDEVAQMMLEGKLKRGKYAHLAPEIRQRLEELERKEAQREAETKAEQERKETAERDAEYHRNDLAHVEAQMATMGATFPMVAALPNVSERLLARLYAEVKAIPAHEYDQGKRPDMAKSLEALTGELTADLTALLTNEASAKALCSIPAIRDTVAKVLGLQVHEQAPQTSPASDETGKPKAGDGPRSLTASVASEVPSRTPGPVSEKERLARQRKAGRQVLGL